MDDDLLDRLLAELRTLAGEPSLEYTAPPVRLTGGFWAELYAFSLASAPSAWTGELVVRLMPDPGLAAKETVIQRWVASAGFATPAVRGSAGPDTGVGRPFMVMDRAEGAPMLADLHGGRALARLPRLARRIPDVLADTMARLHDLDPTAVEAQLVDVAGVTSGFGSLLEALRVGAEVRGRSDLVSAIDRLVARQPHSAERVICHGDLHPFNLLVDADANVTVLDWSAAVIGPAAYDVAFTSLLLAEPPVAIPASVRPLVRGIGGRLAHRFVQRYERLSGSAIAADVLSWHQAVVCVRALVEVAAWVDDETVDSRGGHPWLVCGDAFAARVGTVTGVRVRPR